MAELSADAFGVSTELDPSAFDFSAPEQDSALTQGTVTALNSLATTKALGIGDFKEGARLTAERAAYARANPGSKEGNELYDAWQQGEGIAGGLENVAGEFAKDWREAPGVLAGVAATGKNLAAMGTGVVKQIPNMVLPMAGLLAGGAAGSMVAPGAGTVAGAFAGASAGNTAMEAAGQVDRALQIAGIDPNDTDAVSEFLGANGASILGKSAVKGGIIGAVDTATMGIGGKLLTAPARAAADKVMVELGVNLADKAAVKAAMAVPANRLAVKTAVEAADQGLGKVAREGTVAALEPGGEFAGEYLGEGIANDNWDTKDAFLEAASSIGQSAITYAGQKAYQGAVSPLRGMAADQAAPPVPVVTDPTTGADVQVDPTAGPLSASLATVAQLKTAEELDAGFASQNIDAIDLGGEALEADPATTGATPDATLPLVGQEAAPVVAQPIYTGEPENTKAAELQAYYEAQRAAQAGATDEATLNTAETRPQIPGVELATETQNTLTNPEPNNGIANPVDLAVQPSATQAALASEEALAGKLSNPRDEQLYAETEGQPTPGGIDAASNQTAQAEQAAPQGPQQQSAAPVVTARPAALPASPHVTTIARALPDAQDIQVHSSDSLGSEVSSVTSGQMGKWRAKTIERIAKTFGRKRVVFYSSANATADGMNIGGGDTLYVNINAGTDPLAVVGHEWRHTLAKTNAKAHTAIQTATRAILAKDGRLLQFAQQYHAADLAQGDQATPELRERMARIEAGQATEQDTDFLAEEFSADITGNMWRDPAALKEVFDAILEQHPPTVARTIIKSIGDALLNLINKLVLSTPKGQYSELGVSREELLGLKKEIQAAMGESVRQDTKRRFDAIREARTGSEEVKLATKRTSDNGHKITKAGVYVGAPPGMTSAKLGALRQRLEKITLEGEPGRFWYEESSKAILDIAEGDKGLAEKLAGLLAIYSPQATVSANTSMGLKALYQYMAGEPIEARFETQNKKATAWMNGTMGEDDALQIKTGNFFRNLMRKIDEDRYGYDAQGATIDMWMARMFGYGSKAIGSEARYTFAERETKRLAEKLGWEPQQVQAAIWVAIKSRIEAIADNAREIGIEKGWLEKKVVKVKGKENISWPPKDGPSRELYENMILKMALSGEADPSGLLKASYNFGTALKERVGQISWEAIPGKTANFLPGIFEAPLEQQTEYLAAMDRALRDENGQDLIAKKLGLPVFSTAFGPSAWQMDVGAGAQTTVAISTERDQGNKKISVSDPAKKLINAYAAIRGLILRQEAVVWHFPIFSASKKDANGIQLDIGRDPTHNETVALYNAIHEVSGRDDWAPAYVPGVGWRVLNFSDVPNVEFHKLVKRAAGSEGIPDYFDKTFQSDGDYISNDWEKNPDGSGYKDWIENGQVLRIDARGTGRPDLQGWVESELRPRAERVNKEFAEKYGWDVKRSPNRGHERSGSGVEDSGPRGSVPGRPAQSEGQVNLTGVHFSKEPRTRLSGVYFGAGTKSQEAERIKAATDERLKSRIYAYVNEGKGVFPGEGVGSHAHAVNLDNLYDAVSDPKDIWVKYRDANARESAALDAGFDGYYARGAFGNQGVAILMGNAATKGIPAEYKGNDYRGKDLDVPPVGEKSDFGKLQQKVMANNALPGGEMTGADWKRMMPRLMPEVDVSHLQDDERYYKDQLVLRPKLSTARLQSKNEIPAERPIDLPIDGARLKALRRAAVGLERTQDGVFLRVTEDGEAIATGQKGQRIPESFRRFANDNGLTFKAERRLPQPIYRDSYVAPQSEPMPIEYRQGGALYFGEGVGVPLDRTDGTRFSTPRFVSQLSQVVGQLPAKQETMPAPQWRMWLNGNAAKFGIKKDEIEWSGILDYLTLRGKDKVTKAEVLQFLSENGTTVRDVVLGDNVEEQYDPLTFDEAQKAIRSGDYVVNQWGGRIRPDRIQMMSEGDTYYKVTGGRESGKTKFSGYVVPGGSNYRELLITLPDTAREQQKALYDQITELETPHMKRGEDLPADALQKVTALKAQVKALSGKLQTPFRSGHWDHPNILVHLRMDERTDAEGARVLFLQEIQSDWQQAKRDGKNVPDGPFINDTKSTVALGLKRAIMYAVQHGMSKVAWASGEQNADHYDLTKTLSEIQWHPEAEALTAWDTRGVRVIEKYINEEELEGAVGKEVAAKLIDPASFDEETGARTVRGDNLKVGGEGMKTFYDAIVPQVANDVLKKLGGGKVESITLPDSSFKTKQGAEDDALLGDLGVEVKGTRPAAQQGFTITPEMQAEVSEGVPLFSTRRASIPELSELLNGKPIADLKTSDAPHQGAAVLREWAVGIFRDYGFYANNPDLGKVLMDERSVRDSLGHGRLNPFKAVAFKAVPDLIEKGKIAHVEEKGRTASIYVVAPVVIDGTDDVLTVLIHKDMNTQRMYLHSVISKENLLGDRVPGADAVEASERSGASREGGIRTVLRDALNYKGDTRRSTPRGATTNQPINQAWQSPDNLGPWDNFVRSMQDKLVDTKRVLAEIRKAGVAIRDNIDPYLQEVLYHGRAAKRVSDFADSELRPLLVEMGMRKIERQEMEDYLWARHAKERNAQIAKINPNMPDAGSGLTNQQAADILAGQQVTVGGRDIKLDLAKMAGYQSVAKRVDAITKETTDTLVRYGLETQATVDAWRNTYSQYAPLMRDMEADDNYAGAFNLGLGTGQGFSVRGSASKRAMGSEKGVIDILANVAMQRERAIVRGEKNRVAQALYGLAITAPNPDFWLPLNPDAKKTPAQVTAELIQLGLNPIDAANIANEPKQRYTDPNTGMVMERINPQLRTRGDVLALRINGQDRYVMFSSDERAQQMVRGLKNLDAEQLGLVLQKMAVVTRWFASINTQYNPVFGLTNGLRDLGTGMLNLSSTDLKGHQGTVFKNAFSALGGVYSDLRAHRAGKVPTSRWALAFEEFASEGGQTGYRDMFQTSKERTDALMKELKDATKGKTLLTFSERRSPLFGWLSDYNTAIENAVRLSAYQAAKDKGLTKQQAASLAKNLTVNFNKKGLAAAQLGAMYAFFNAAVQGTARIGTTMVTDANGKPSLTAAGKKILYGGMMAGALQAVMFAAAGYDDEEPPQFAREKNFIIPLGGGKYLSVPYPLGFHVIPNIGRIGAEFALGGFKNPGKRLVDIFSMVLDGFNPIGGSSGGVSQLLSPTVTDPLVALSENKDWTGKSIYKEDFNAMHPTAGWTRKKDNASALSNWLAYGVNYVTGGGKYEIGLLSPTPDQIDYLIGQGTGGVGREGLKAWQAGTTAASGEEMPMYKVPVAGRFIGETTGQASEVSRFYNSLKRIGAHKSALDEMKEAGDVQAMIRYRKENPDAMLVKQADQAATEINKIKRRKRELLEKDAGKDQIRMIDLQLTARVKRYNEILSEPR